MLWFDAHLDLACLAVNGRDMLAPAESCGGPWLPASTTLRTLHEGGVRVALATIFTEPDGQDREGYPAGDVEHAHRAGRAQLEVYESWRDEERIAVDLRSLLRNDPGVGEVRGGMGVARVAPLSLEKRLRAVGPAPLHVGVLIENADPIRSPDDLPWWKERGVVAIGLAWAKSSRYAMGNSTPHEERIGLTHLGRAMVRAMDALGVVHDVSHLSDRAMDELFSITDRPVIASHSNCRALLKDPRNQRHLRDESIREIARRGGVIGLNLCRNFIAPLPYRKEDPRPSIEQAIAHVEHVCGVAGGRGHVGLGSDLDGGFSANDLPEGINRPGDFEKLADALRARGWRETDVEGFAHGNWARFFHQRE
jgi:membrane dipeptidase